MLIASLNIELTQTAAGMRFLLHRVNFFILQEGHCIRLISPNQGVIVNNKNCNN